MVVAAKVQQHTFDADKLAINRATVYVDRAEVIKSIRIQLNPGLNEIVVKRLTKFIESDSIRVEGYGKAIIREVKYQEKHVKQDEDVKQNEKELKAQLKVLTEQRTKSYQKQQRWQTQRNVLDGMAVQIESGGVQNEKKTSDGLNLITGSNLNNLDGFLAFYDRQAENIDNEITNVKKHLEKLDEETSVVRKNLQSQHSNESYMSREVSVLVQSDEAELVELKLSYLVTNASWTPTYDIRVSTVENSLQVLYYGLIKQNTDEDWPDVHLSLSTAMPSIGGQMPELKTLKVGFPSKLVEEVIHGRRSLLEVLERSETLCSAGLADDGFGSLSLKMKKSTAAVRSRPSKESYTMAKPRAEVAETVLCASFDIQHKTTIPSDNTFHKVTVAVIDLKPLFQYETFPCKSSYAFLKAKTTNVSQCPFLPGPTDVFLDNNFVAKSSMKSVSPLEEFECSLGVDPSIRVEYKPARKFHEESGILSKTSTVTHEQKIEIKNTKNDSIKITLTDQLPLSNEEKIKVHLLEPNFSRIEKGCTVTKNEENNIEFEMIIPKNECREVILKYSVEFPKGEHLFYHEE